MTRLAMRGWESRDTNTTDPFMAEDGYSTTAVNSVGPLSVDTTNERISGAALLIPAGVAAQRKDIIVFPVIPYGRSCFSRFYFRYSNNPSAIATLAALSNAAGALVYVGLATDGTVFLMDAGFAGFGRQTGDTLSKNVWHRIEFRGKYASSPTVSNAEIELLIDGQQIAVTTAANMGTGTGIDRLEIGNLGTAANPVPTGGYLFDDAAVNDDQGANQNTWPGAGHIVDLLPASDVAGSSANWLTGSDATTNRWDAENNTPPVGVAPANDTATSQIRNAIKDTSGYYEAETTTFTAAGISSTDQLKVLIGILNYGTGLTTAMQPGFQVTNFNGVLAAEVTGAATPAVAVGVHPLNWRAAVTAPVYSPAPTSRSTGVRLRVRKVTNNATALHVESMRAIVEYAPAIPVITLGSRSTSRISRVAGFDSTVFSFQVNMAYSAYELRVVSNVNDPRSSGQLIESGGPGAANTNRNVDITDDELIAAIGSVIDGSKTVKVFVQDSEGDWYS